MSNDRCMNSDGPKFHVKRGVCVSTHIGDSHHSTLMSVIEGAEEHEYNVPRAAKKRYIRLIGLFHKKKLTERYGHWRLVLIHLHYVAHIMPPFPDYRIRSQIL